MNETPDTDGRGACIPCGLLIWASDLGILRADAEDATTAVANDVDLDLVSADAELEER